MSDGLTFAYSLLSRLAVLSVLPVTLMPRLSKCLAIKKNNYKNSRLERLPTLLVFKEKK